MTDTSTNDGFVGTQASVLATKDAPDTQYYRDIKKSAYILIQANQGTDWLYETTNDKRRTIWKAADGSGKECNVDPTTNTIVQSK